MYMCVCEVNNSKLEIKDSAREQSLPFIPAMTAMYRRAEGLAVLFETHTQIA